MMQQPPPQALGQQQQQQQNLVQPPLPPMPHPSVLSELHGQRPQHPPLASHAVLPEFHRGPPPPMRQPSMSSTNVTPDYSHPPPYDAYGDSFAAKRMRKIVQRRTVDYASTAVRYIQVRMWQRDARDRIALQPTAAAILDMLPPVAYADNPSTSFTAKFVHASTNKNKCSINCVLWTPTGRRLITGSQSGELTLWNGQSFNFEMILQAHENAIRSMIWSKNESWMVTGDDGGAIKYWQSNMNNVKANKTAHKESVRGLSFCRTDLKFCSCSDDTTVKVWDFARCQEERSLTGHGWDVKSIDWHPTKSLLVSGGKDHLVKLWDAKTGQELFSFVGHKNTVLRVKWNQNGNWLLTASKDQIIKLYDIRSMKELESFRGHNKDVTALAWHPFHEEYFVSGSFDGSIFHWLVGHETPQAEVLGAHDGGVWDLDWHPVGYLLCSGSNDFTTKFWSRNRPGDVGRDKYSNQISAHGDHNAVLSARPAGGYPMLESTPNPGPFLPGITRTEGAIPGIGMPLSIHSLDGFGQGDQRPSHPALSSGQPPLPPGPHPSLLASAQQQPFHQVSQQVPSQQQHLQFSQQLPSMGTANLPLLQQPHMSLPLHGLRPPLPQMPPHGISTSVSSSLQGSLPIPSPATPLPNPAGMQGSANHIISPVPQHLMGLNQLNSGPGMPTIGGSATAMTNIPGLSGTPGLQNFTLPGTFNRPPGQVAPFPGLGAYQPPILDVRLPGLGATGGNTALPQPQQPPSHGSAPQ